MFSGVKDVSAKDGISNQWVERGPYSVGGRVRGIMFDPNDASGKKFGPAACPVVFGIIMTSPGRLLNGR